MVYKGSVSYQNDNVNYIAVGGGVEAKIQRMDRAFCMITFVDAQDNQVLIPQGLNLVFQADNTQVGRVGQGFIITWAEDYVCTLNGCELFRLENQKQQAIGGELDLTTRFVQA